MNLFTKYKSEETASRLAVNEDKPFVIHAFVGTRRENRTLLQFNLPRFNNISLS